MARGQQHSDDLKAQVVADLLAGLGVSEVARKYKLSKSVVSGWKNAGPTDQFQQVITDRRRRIEERVLSYLEAAFLTAESLLAVMRDPEYQRAWPMKQVSDAQAQVVDRGIRVLEALSDDEGEDEPEEDEAG